MKRNLAFISVVLTALLICLSAIGPTEAGRSQGLGDEIVAVPGGPENTLTGLNAQMKDKDTPAVSGQTTSKRDDPDLAKALRNYDLIRLDPGAAAAQIRDTGRLLISTPEGSFDMQLAPHDLRASDYVAQVITADGTAHKLPKLPVNTYKGSVKGSPGAQVRMTVKESNIEGLIILESGRFFIQPASSLSKTSRVDEFVFYKDSDVTSQGGVCGVTLADEVAAEEARSAAHLETETPEVASAVTALSPLKIARIATDADAEYVAALGGPAQANAEIMSIMNFVDGIYQVEIGVTFQFAFQNNWIDAATDPYTSTNPATLLDQFSLHWNTNFTGIQRSLAHLWTGKDLNGGVIGVAAPAAVCRFPGSAYGLSQRFPLGGGISASTVVLTAHELGHNFSAAHPDQANQFVPPDVEQPCQNTIMGAFIGTGSNFCPFSRSQIVGHANAHDSCLTDSTVLPPTPACLEIPINTSGVDTNGALSTSDCGAQSRGTRFFADQYSFNATAGQQVTITMNRSSGDLDPYLYLIGPDGDVVIQDDNNNGNNNARIPNPVFQPALTLPLTGKYIIEATSAGLQQTGGYTLNATMANCTFSVDPTSQHFSAAGGSGVLNVTAVGSCFSYGMLQHPGISWLTPLNSLGVGSQAMNFTVAANSNSAGRRGFLLISSGQGFGGLRIPITQSGTRPDCGLTPIAPGQTIEGSLSSTDCHSPVRGNGFFADRYVFNVLAGQKVAIGLSSPGAPNPDTFLTLLGPNGVVILTDDDSGGFTNSRIPGGPGFLTLGLPGTYIVEVGAFSIGETGPYALNLTFGSSSSSVSFESPVLDVSEGVDANGIGFEGTGFRTITVQRSGDISGGATVDYVTSNGSAEVRKDYAQALGTLRFAPGETSKSFVVHIADDVFQEAPETVNLTLVNPVGAVLGPTPAAVLTINSNDAVTGSNPVDPSSFNTGFFVRQHYLDFFTREPDIGGLNFWKNQIDECQTEACREIRRINVSAAFFLSIEFQQTGYLVYRTFTTAFGPTRIGATVPVTLTEFVPDVQRIGKGVVLGMPGADLLLEANKQAYFNEFVARPQFLGQYPLFMPRAQLVDALNSNAGGVLSQLERDALVNGTQTRAQVLRAVAEDVDLVNAHFNKAFVLMQYFGYLRRNPNDSPEITLDFQGYNFWLTKLNSFGGNFVNAEMVKAFIISTEYRQRFGP